MPRRGNGGVVGPANTTNGGVFGLYDVIIKTDRNEWGEGFITASGGTETTDGDYKIHTFTSSGTFTLSKLATNAADNTVSYLIVAGGGSSGGGVSGAHTGGGG